MLLFNCIVLYRDVFGWFRLVMIVVEAHPLNLMALLQGLSKLVHGLVGQGTLCLEPHALHLIQVLHCRRPLLKPYTHTHTHFYYHTVWPKMGCSQ